MAELEEPEEAQPETVVQFTSMLLMLSLLAVLLPLQI